MKCSRIARGLAAFILPMAVLTGCTGVDILDPDEKPAAKSAYIFGRFAHRVEEHRGGFGLAIRHAITGREYVLPFRRGQSLYAVAVDPGSYKITEVVYLTNLGREKARRLFLPPKSFEYMTRLFVARPGRLTYLGDFEGSTLIRGKEHIWRFHSIQDRYESAGKELARAYPLLKTAPNQRRAFTSGK